MLKDFIKENGHKIYISVNMGILIMGILMTFIGVYSPICGDTQNDIRITIGTVCIALWFIMFPAISRDKKDKIMSAPPSPNFSNSQEIILEMLIHTGFSKLKCVKILLFAEEPRQVNLYMVNL